MNPLTSKLEEFGYIELEAARSILQKLQKADTSEFDGLSLKFNKSSGEVFLLDDNDRVIVQRGSNLFLELDTLIDGETCYKPLIEDRVLLPNFNPDNSHIETHFGSLSNLVADKLYKGCLYYHALQYGVWETRTEPPYEYNVGPERLETKYGGLLRYLAIALLTAFLQLDDYEDDTEAYYQRLLLSAYDFLNSAAGAKVPEAQNLDYHEVIKTFGDFWEAEFRYAEFHKEYKGIQGEALE